MKIKSYESSFFFGLIFFFLFFLFIAPFFQEVWHVLLLSVYDCKYYKLSFHTNVLSGLSATIKVFCPLEPRKFATLLLSGVLGNLLLGFIFIFLGMKLTKTRPALSIFLTLVLSSFAIDAAVSFFFDEESDLVSALRIFNLEKYDFILVLMGFFLLFLIFFFISKILEISSERYLEKKVMKE